MENDAPHTQGGESGQAHSGGPSGWRSGKGDWKRTSGPYGGTDDKDTYDHWYGVGEGMETAKDRGKNFGGDGMPKD